MPRRTEKPILWTVLIKGTNKIRAYRVHDDLPKIDVGNYSVGKDEESGKVLVTTYAGEKAQIETVRFKGASWVMKKDEETGKVELVPAPETFGFCIEKDSEGNVNVRPMTNAVRAFVSAYMPDGTYGLLKSGEQIEIKKLV